MCVFAFALNCQVRAERNESHDDPTRRATHDLSDVRLDSGIQGKGFVLQKSPMAFVPFPHIESLKHLDRNLRRSGSYAELPATLTYRGTVKLHGTNAGIRQLEPDGDLYVQSRNRMISVASDNFGFAAFVEQQTRPLKGLFAKLREALPLDRAGAPCTLFGEWCGCGIQKDVAVGTLPKFFAIFAVRVDETYWDLASLPDLQAVDARVYSVLQFGTYHLQLSSCDVMAGKAEIERATAAVCERCPAGLLLSAVGRGEGIVWQCLDRLGDAELWFKSKGEEFTVAIAKMDVSADLVVRAKAFAKATLTTWRLEQAEAFARDKAQGKGVIPALLQWAVSDALREEGLDLPSDDLPTYKKELERVARAWALERCRSA